MVGQFKDDAIQSHKHGLSEVPGGNAGGAGTATNKFGAVQLGVLFADGYSTDVNGGRRDTVTRGKRKGVKYIIKVL